MDSDHGAVRGDAPLRPGRAPTRSPALGSFGVSPDVRGDQSVGSPAEGHPGSIAGVGRGPGERMRVPGRRMGRPVGATPMPRYRGAGRGRAAPTPLSSPPQRDRDKAPPAERPRGAGLCLPGPSSGRAPARCRCGARSLPVPYLLVRRGARRGLPARSIVLPATRRGPAGRERGAGGGGTAPLPAP